MIKNVLNKFGFVRIALVAGAGLPLIFASNSFAQTPAPFAQPPPPGGPEAPGGADRPATTTAPPPGVTYTGEVPPPGEAVAERVIVTGSNIPTAQEQSSIPATTYTVPVAPEIGQQYAGGRIASASYLCRKRRVGK